MVRVPHASRRLCWLLLAFEATQYACSTSTGRGSSLGDWLGVLVPLRIYPAYVGFARHSCVIPRFPWWSRHVRWIFKLCVEPASRQIALLCGAVHVHSCGRCGQRRSRSRLRQLRL